MITRDDVYRRRFELYASQIKMDGRLRRYIGRIVDKHHYYIEAYVSGNIQLFEFHTYKGILTFGFNERAPVNVLSFVGTDFEFNRTLKLIRDKTRMLKSLKITVWRKNTKKVFDGYVVSLNTRKAMWVFPIELVDEIMTYL